MCGIGGMYVPNGKKPLSFDYVTRLFCNLEDRGTHAAGFSYRAKGSTHDIVVKQPGRASRLTDHLTSMLIHEKDTRYVLLHTRFTTQGSVEYNGNNHPVIGHDIVLTHNGVLWGEGKVFRQLGVDRLHDVDTEAINAALSRKSPGWVLDNIQGTMSIAWTDSRESQETVHLMTNGGNPLVIGRTKSGVIVWASTQNHLDDLDMDTWFHATPFKHYTIHEDGKITSEYVSKQRKVSNKSLIHASQFGGQGHGRKPKKKAKPKVWTLSSDEWEYLPDAEMFMKKEVVR